MFKQNLRINLTKINQNEASNINFSWNVLLPGVWQLQLPAD